MSDSIINYYGHGIAVRMSRPSITELIVDGAVVKSGKGYGECLDIEREALALAESRMGH